MKKVVKFLLIFLVINMNCIVNAGFVLLKTKITLTNVDSDVKIIELIGIHGEKVEYDIEKIISEKNLEFEDAKVSYNDERKIIEIDAFSEFDYNNWTIKYKNGDIDNIDISYKTEKIPNKGIEQRVSNIEYNVKTKIKKEMKYYETDKRYYIFVGVTVATVIAIGPVVYFIKKKQVGDNNKQS